MPYKQDVGGSSPSLPTIFILELLKAAILQDRQERGDCCSRWPRIPGSRNSKLLREHALAHAVLFSAAPLKFGAVCAILP